MAGEDVLEMELEKLFQDPGEELSGRLASGPNCIWEGTTCMVGLVLRENCDSKPVVRS